MQDAYLRAWRFRDSLSAVPSIRPWLYRVVVNSCYSKLRREIPHRDRRAGDEPLAHVPAPGVDPETRAEQGEVAETVLAALQQLPAVAARPGRPALLRRPERARHRARHRPAPGHGEVPPARSPPPPGGRPRPVRPRRAPGHAPRTGGDRPMTMLDDDRLASLLGRAGGRLRRPGVGRRRHSGPGGAARPGGRRRCRRRATQDGDRRRRRSDGRGRSTTSRPARGSAWPHHRRGATPPGALGGRLRRRPARARRGGRRAACAARRARRSPPGRRRPSEPAPSSAPTPTDHDHRAQPAVPTGRRAPPAGAALRHQLAARQCAGGRRPTQPAADARHERAGTAERCRRPVRQNRADRLAGADRRPRQA